MKKLITLSLIMVMIISLAACGSNSGKTAEGTAAADTAKKLQKLNVGVMPDVDSIPLVIAKQKGFFEQEGVDVNIMPFKSAPERDSAFQSGQLDGAISDILAAALAKEGGFDVKITSRSNGSYKLIAGAKSDIKDITGLKGKSIAISKNTIIEYVTDSMLTKADIKQDEVNKVIVPQIAVRLEMLQNGKVDAATLPEPMASVAIANGGRLINSSDNLGINPGIVYFTKDAIDSKSEEIKAFYRAYNLAVDYLEKEDLSSYIDILIKESSFPDAVKGNLVLPTFEKGALPSKSDFDGGIQWLKGLGLIKNTYEYNDLIDESLVKS